MHLVEGTEALYPREDLYPADDIYPADENALDSVSKAYYKEISFENYRVAPITKVQLVEKSGAIAASFGTGTNVFTLKDNPLIWGLSAQILNSVATNLYNTIQGLWYTPSQIECVGLPYVECGDFVLMVARRSIVRAYVLARTLHGIQIINDSYQADGDRYQPTYVPDIQTQANANAQNITNETERASTAERAEATTRQSQINSEAATRQSQINAVNVRCDNLNARAANIESLVATKASISDLNATNANVSNLAARTANVENLVATKASISDLNAANARISNLQTSKLSTSNLSSAISNLSRVEIHGYLIVGDYNARWMTKSVALPGGGTTSITYLGR